MDITHEKPTALAVQQNALTALLADPERLNALDADKLERLFDLNERMLAAQARLEFKAAFKAVQDEIEPVPKRGLIDYGNGQKPSPYAKPEDVANMLRPHLKKNGLSYSTSTKGVTPVVSGSVISGRGGKTSNATLTRISLTLRHVGGYEEEHHLDVPIGAGHGGSMNIMQAIGSTASYCEKILLCKVFGAVTHDDFDGKEIKGLEPITEEQVAYIEALSKEAEVGTGFAEFMRDMFRVEGIAQIAKADYLKAARAIKSRMKTKGIPVPPHLEEPWALETKRRAQ